MYKCLFKSANGLNVDLGSTIGKNVDGANYELVAAQCTNDGLPIKKCGNIDSIAAKCANVNLTVAKCANLDLNAAKCANACLVTG